MFQKSLPGFGGWASTMPGNHPRVFIAGLDLDYTALACWYARKFWPDSFTPRSPPRPAHILCV
ncbi:MAG: hypothetical protein ACKV22_22675 [Bryobacteraceae bacterium]